MPPTLSAVLGPLVGLEIPGTGATRLRGCPDRRARPGARDLARTRPPRRRLPRLPDDDHHLDEESLMPPWPRVIADLPEPLAALLGAGSYRTHRPACQGHAPLFDESVWGETAQQREERHDRARQVCDRCPAHAACAAALAELPRVWAGVVLSDERYRTAAPR